MEFTIKVFIEGLGVTDVLVDEENGCYGASIPKLPGVFTVGDDLEEIKENIVEAAAVHLEMLDISPINLPTSNDDNSDFLLKQ
jgi:predicted RNase H-like HicB family nuclease